MSFADPIRRILADSRPRTRLLVSVVVVAFLGRFWLGYVSEGTNDIRAWLRFGKLVNAYGLGEAYVRDPLLNHPPLMSLWAALCARLSHDSILPFARLFKLPSLIAEVCTGLLVWRAYVQRGERDQAFYALAIYALALGNVLICAFHGNTDCIYFALAFAAAFLLQERQSGLLAGLALAAALNVKLIPIVLVLPLAAVCRDRRVFVRYGLALSAAVVPFALALASFTPDQRAHFFVNVFGYKSYPEWWGVELITRTLVAATARSLPGLTLTIQQLHDAYFLAGGKVLVALSGVLALWSRWGSWWSLARGEIGRELRLPNAYALCAVAYASFVLLGPGFGVQYLGCLLAPFLMLSLGGGTQVALATALTVSALYLHFMVSWSPMSSEHTPFPADFAGISLLTWSILAAQSLRALHRVRPPTP